MRSAFTVTLQVAPAVLSQPVEAAKGEPTGGEEVRVSAVPGATEAVQVVPQLMAPPVTVPEPRPAFCTVRVTGAWLKVAVTMRSALTVTLQVAPAVLSQPVQAAKVEPAAGEAVRVSAVPGATEAVQVVPQLMVPPVTVPEPRPAFCTVRVTGAWLKVAVTMRSAFTVTLQVAPAALSQPVQAAKV